MPVDAGRRTRAGNHSRAGSEERTDLPALPGGTEEEEEDRREAADRSARKVAEWEVLGEFQCTAFSSCAPSSTSQNNAFWVDLTHHNFG